MGVLPRKLQTNRRLNFYLKNYTAKNHFFHDIGEDFKDFEHYFAPDRIHLNSAGKEKLAQTLAGLTKKLDKREKVEKSVAGETKVTEIQGSEAKTKEQVYEVQDEKRDKEPSKSQGESFLMVDQEEDQEKVKYIEDLQDLEAKLSQKKRDKEEQKKEEEALEKQLEKSSEMNITAVIPAYQSTPPNSPATTPKPARKATRKGKKSSGSKNSAAKTPALQKRQENAHPKPEKPAAMHPAPHINFVPVQTIKDINARNEKERENLKRKIRADVEASFRIKFRKQMAKMQEHYQQQSKMTTEGSVRLVEKVPYYQDL